VIVFLVVDDHIIQTVEASGLTKVLKTGLPLALLAAPLGAGFLGPRHHPVAPSHPSPKVSTKIIHVPQPVPVPFPVHHHHKVVVKHHHHKGKTKIVHIPAPKPEKLTIYEEEPIFIDDGHIFGATNSGGYKGNDIGHASFLEGGYGGDDQHISASNTRSRKSHRKKHHADGQFGGQGMASAHQYHLQRQHLPQGDHQHHVVHDDGHKATIQQYHFRGHHKHH